MPTTSENLLVISDFNSANFCNILNNATPLLVAEAAPYGQVVQALAALPDARCSYVLVWCRPEKVLAGFARMLALEDAAPDEVLQEAAKFLQLLAHRASGRKKMFVAKFVSPEYTDADGSLGVSNNVSATLLRLNLLLLDFAKQNNWCVLDAEKWLRRAGPGWNSPKTWYLAKMPYSNPVYASAARDLLAELDALNGRSKKVIACDLDNTLWGGVVGDDGWEGLKLGGHDAVGEAYRDLQLWLKRLKNQGVVLCIASKNEEANALEALARHPDMALRLSDFAAYRINWNDKAESLKSIAEELNLTLDSFVFLDDNPAERDRVRTALPQVAVPDLPGDPMLFPSFLMSLDCFRKQELSDEDRQRTDLYIGQRERSKELANSMDLNDWLARLGTRVEIDNLNQQTLLRACQLLNKTNQMNLRTRRLSEQELMHWASEPCNRAWTVRASDKFGDNGLIGVMSLTARGDAAFIEDFVLSCRVMGRNVERAMLHALQRFAREMRLKKVEAVVLPTAKNAPCRDFFRTCSGFAETSDLNFELATEADYSNPEHIHTIISDLR